MEPLRVLMASWEDVIESFFREWRVIQFLEVRRCTARAVRATWPEVHPVFSRRSLRLERSCISDQRLLDERTRDVTVY